MSAQIAIPQDLVYSTLHAHTRGRGRGRANYFDRNRGGQFQHSRPPYFSPMVQMLSHLIIKYWYVVVGLRQVIHVCFMLI